MNRAAGASGMSAVDPLPQIESEYALAYYGSIVREAAARGIRQAPSKQPLGVFREVFAGRPRAERGGQPGSPSDGNALRRDRNGAFEEARS